MYLCSSRDLSRQRLTILHSMSAIEITFRLFTLLRLLQLMLALFILSTLLAFLQPFFSSFLPESIRSTLPSPSFPLLLLLLSRAKDLYCLRFSSRNSLPCLKHMAFFSVEWLPYSWKILFSCTFASYFNL